MPPKHRRGHSAIVNTSAFAPNIPQFQATVQDYDPVAQSDDEPAEKPAPTPAEIDFDEALHEQGCPRCAQRSQLSQRRLPWIVACAVLTVTCLWLFSTRPSASAAAASAGSKGAVKEPAVPLAGGAGASYERGFKNDLAPFIPHLSLTTVDFSGAVEFDAAGKGKVPAGPNQPSYVGTPSPQIDAAWDELLRDRYFLLSEDEARAAWGPDYKKWWVDERGGYLAGIDMLHSLNCLNHLRQALDPEYYPHQTITDTEWHHDHCVDHLRQLIMCHGDITPIPSRFVPGLRQYYVHTARQHTCRNFSALRAFATERAVGKSAVKPVNQKHPNM